MMNDVSYDVKMFSWPIVFLAGATICVMNILPVSSHLGGPMKCSKIGSSCQAYLYYNRNNSDTLHYLTSLFSVPETAIMQEVATPRPNGVVVSVQCLCSASLKYQAEATYRWNLGDTQASIIGGAYKNLASMPEDNFVAGQLLQMKLFCACIDADGQSLLTYVLQKSDTLDSLAVRFNTSKETMMKVNDVKHEEHLTAQAVYYIPIRDSGLKQAVVPASEPTGHASGGANVALGAIVGIVLAGLLLIAAVAGLVFCLQTKQICCYGDHKEDTSVRRGRRSPCNVRSISPRQSKRAIGIQLQSRPLNNKNHIINSQNQVSTSMPNDRITSFNGMERPIIFGYDEIVAATMSFKDSNQIGVGEHGPVYFGLLRDQEVAIKKLSSRKMKGVPEKLTALCTLHHANLVELKGYCINEFDLYLVYEYAKNGTVSDRLQNPHLKGFTHLTWNARVQIALDAAKGLEFIHQQNKAQFVHCAVRTSNIVLDGCLRAKVADFGIKTLLEQSEIDAATVKQPMTSFAYRAPESVRDGQVTSKSDVYAFGVVLFELITGEGAALTIKASRPDRPSLIALMLSALSDTSKDRAMLKAITDPLLMDTYSLDSVHKMATLGQQCVEEDPDDRPSMTRIVLTLSQLLLGSIEWGKALGGGNQVSSGFI